MKRLFIAFASVTILMSASHAAAQGFTPRKARTLPIPFPSLHNPHLIKNPLAPIAAAVAAAPQMRRGETVPQPLTRHFVRVPERPVIASAAAFSRATDQTLASLRAMMLGADDLLHDLFSDR